MTDEELDTLMEECDISEQSAPQDTVDIDYDGGLPPYMENM